MGPQTGLGRGLTVKLKSVKRSRSGLVQVWFSIDLKFNSFELDSEVGRLVPARVNEALALIDGGNHLAARTLNVGVIRNYFAAGILKDLVAGLSKGRSSRSCMWANL